MNRLFLIILILGITTVMSCNSIGSCVEIDDLNFKDLDQNRVVLIRNKSSKNQDITILLQDSTPREKYELRSNALTRYIFYDNSSYNNDPKYILKFEKGCNVNTIGKSIYVVSEAFNPEFKLTVGDTLELGIRAANPVFLKNSLTVTRNEKKIIQDYQFKVNRDEISLFYIVKEKGNLDYFIVYNLYSEYLGYNNCDSIKFKIKAD